MSKCTVCFCGLNAEKEVTALANQGFLLYNSYKYDARTTCITLPSRQVKKVVAYLTKKCYNVKYVEPKGAYGVFRTLLARPLIATMLALLILAVVVCSTLCLRVECNARTDEVLTALGDYGVTLGGSLRDLNVDELENFLCVRLDCAYAIVSVDGCVLNVEIVERVKVPKPIDLNSPDSILCTREGVVTRVITLNGTAKVKAGDYVSQGQVLIEGVRTYKDGTTAPTTALGEVYGQVCASHTVTHQPERYVYERSGNSVKLVRVKVGEAVSSCRKSIPYAHYESVTEHYLLFPLGIEIIMQRVYELTPVAVITSFEQDKERLKTIALLAATEKADFEIIRTEYIIEGDSVTAVVYGELLLNAAGETFDENINQN